MRDFSLRDLDWKYILQVITITLCIWFTRWLAICDYTD